MINSSPKFNKPNMNTKHGTTDIKKDNTKDQTNQQIPAKKTDYNNQQIPSNPSDMRNPQNPLDLTDKRNQHNQVDQKDNKDNCGTGECNPQSDKINKQNPEYKRQEDLIDTTDGRNMDKKNEGVKLPSDPLAQGRQENKFQGQNQNRNEGVKLPSDPLAQGKQDNKLLGKDHH